MYELNYSERYRKVYAMLVYKRTAEMICFQFWYEILLFVHLSTAILVQNDHILNMAQKLGARHFRSSQN